MDGPRVVVTPVGKKCLMAALDKRDGSTVWTSPPRDDDRPSYCSPILFRFGGRRLLATCSGGHGFGVDADTGQLQWTVPLPNRYEVNVATPIYGGGCIFYVTPYAEEGRLYRLQAGPSVTAERVWASPLDTVTGSGVLVDGTLYAAGYRKNKIWFGIDWETGRRGEQPDLTTGGCRVRRWPPVLSGRSRQVGLLGPCPGSLVVAGQFRRSQTRQRRLGPPRLAQRTAVPAISRQALVLRRRRSNEGKLCVKRRTKTLLAILLHD